MKVSVLVSFCKVSEVANIVEGSRTTVYAFKKRMNDGEGVNRRAGSGRKTAVDRNSLRDAIRGLSHFHSIVFLRIHLEIHNKNKPFSLMSLTQSIGQTTRILTKRFVQYFSAHPVCNESILIPITNNIACSSIRFIFFSISTKRNG